MRTVLLLLFSLCPSVGALIPPFFMDTVVALGCMQPVIEAGQPPKLEWMTEGTGFFYGYLIKDDPDVAKRLYDIYLVTAKHVVQEHAVSNCGDIQLRLNPDKAPATVKEFDLPARPKPDADAWFYHPNPSVDIAAIRINLNWLREQGFQGKFFTSDANSASRMKLKDLGVSAGDGVFVLGFPMNLAGAQKNYVIVRQGAIARISELLDGASATFMIDSFVFPGNSGGPVVLKPDLTSIGNTKAQETAYLIGMVISYRPYNDVAVSQQTKQPRVIFQENSGLAEVVPTDYIDETIKAWVGAHNSKL